MAEDTPHRAMPGRSKAAKCVGAILGAILLASANAERADTRSDGPGTVSDAAPTPDKAEIVHYRLIRLPKGTKPTDDDFVGTLDVPRAYLSSTKPPAGSTTTSLGVQIETFYPEMTPLSGTYPPGRPRLRVEIATQAAAADAILSIIDFLKRQGMTHTRDRDDLCGYAMAEKLPEVAWFIPCNGHASDIALITCNGVAVCYLQAAFGNRLAVRIVYPRSLLGESFAIRDAVARLISSFAPTFAQTPAVPAPAPPAPSSPTLSPPPAALPAHKDGSVAAHAGDPSSLHFTLLGPEWEDLPARYSGQVPEKPVAELNIPRGYVESDPAKDRTSSISIALSYPGIKAAADTRARDRISAIIVSRREDTRPPPYLSLSRDAVHEPKLDAGGLCGFIDTQHPGLAGVEFFWPCGEPERTFEVMCSPRFNGRRVCSDSAFVGDHIGVLLSYQMEMLQDRNAIVDAVRKLVLSWE
jgi:hypothetical protein